MDVEKKHEQWRAITESDFVTLFIKTWFTFIAVLRETNPDVNVFAEDGKPRGDKPFLNAYKENIMPIVQKNISVDAISQELFKMHPIGMKKVIEVFPQYFFSTFFRMNESFIYRDKIIDVDAEGKIKERYQVNIHIVDRFKLKFYLGASGYFRTKKYNVEIKQEIDLRPIIEATVAKHRFRNLEVNEIQFLQDFHNGILIEISNVLRNYLVDKLPQKEYNQTINSKIEGAFSRVQSALRIKFEYNYKYPHEVNVLDDSDSYAIAYQLPFNGFGRISQGNVYIQHKEEYSDLIVSRAINWFADYVYSLRNALFHEIISPLDEEWQIIFKSAYLILKQISDVCISSISRIEEFPKSKENAVFDYAEKHEEIFSSLAEYVELLDFSKMSLESWKIENGKTILKGWFLAKLKLQDGAANDIDNGNGMIAEQEKGYDFSIVLDEDFKIIVDRETGNEQIEIKLQDN